MQRKNLFYAFMLCLVMMIAAACSPAAGPSEDGRYGTTGYNDNRAYYNPSGAYDDDRGFKNDFQLSDLNPNLVTGRNDLYNLEDDAKIMAELATTVEGVDNARVNINGGTAHVNLDIEDRSNVQGIKAAVYERLKFKMPRYQIDVDVR